MGNEFINKEQLEELNRAAAEEKQPKRKASRRKKKTADERISESRTLNQLMNGDFLTKKYVLDNFPFLAFVGVLVVLLIAKGYYMQELNNNIEKTKTELGEINAQKVTYGSELYWKKRRPNMVRNLEPLGLKESDKEAPKKILAE